MVFGHDITLDILKMRAELIRIDMEETMRVMNTCLDQLAWYEELEYFRDWQDQQDTFMYDERDYRSRLMCILLCEGGDVLDLYGGLYDEAYIYKLARHIIHMSTSQLYYKARAYLIHLDAQIERANHWHRYDIEFRASLWRYRTEVHRILNSTLIYRCKEEDDGSETFEILSRFREDRVLVVVDFEELQTIEAMCDLLMSEFQ